MEAVDLNWTRMDEQLPPKETWVLFAATFDNDDDWRVKQGIIDADGEVKLLAGSWTPTHWHPMIKSPVGGYFN